ncbi:MAG: type II toxin-antitoxin system VapC family toxin [Candidatus Competibacteraceae bacterium]
MSDILLDSHAFLWFVWDDPLLSPAAKQRIEDPANRKWVSVASCWEIAIKAGLGKLRLGEPATTFLPRELATNHFDLLGIELVHATFVEALPTHHKDPFDRLLAAQALVENIPLMSADAIFDRYGVTRLWN